MVSRIDDRCEIEGNNAAEFEHYRERKYAFLDMK